MRIPTKNLAVLFAAIATLAVTPAFADWHYGTITYLGVGYDGSTIAVAVSGWSRSNCTCYPNWGNSACLNRSRASFREEYAQLLSARRAGVSIGINIDETTCSIVAIYEAD